MRPEAEGSVCRFILLSMPSVPAVRVQNIDCIYQLVSLPERTGDAQVSLIFGVCTPILLSLQCGEDCRINSTSQAQRSIEVN